jgi:hypothetical protein
MFNSNNKLQKIGQSLIVEPDSMLFNIKRENLIVETYPMLLNILLLKNLPNRSLFLLKTQYSEIFGIPIDSNSLLELDNVDDSHQAFHLSHNNKKLHKVDHNLIDQIDSMLPNIKRESNLFQRFNARNFKIDIVYVNFTLQ